MAEITSKVIADILSALTIMSCAFLKVPQIMSIRERRSAEGVYLQAMIMEIVGFSIMTLYNFTNEYSLMTYMEYPIILAQVYVLLYHVLRYKRMLHRNYVRIITFVYVVTVICFAIGIFPKEFLVYLLPICTPLSGFAKVTYIYGIIKAGNADAVSLTTWIISVVTNMIRIFTVFIDSCDTTLIVNFSISTFLSALVLATVALYQYDVPPPPQPQPGLPRREPSYRRHSEAFNKYD